MTRFRSIAYHTGHGIRASGTLSMSPLIPSTICRHTSAASSSAVQSRAALARPCSSGRCSEGGVEVADVHREHRDVAVLGEARPPLPEAVLVDRGQPPLGARVVDVPADQLELGVEVVLDAGQRLEPVPGPAPISAIEYGSGGRRTGRRGSSGLFRRRDGAGEPVAARPPLRRCPRRSGAVIRSAVGASTAVTT